MAKLNPFNSEGVVEKLSWEKPERKDQAGSIIIFGGSSFKLKEVDTIFKKAKASGIGQASALVPESLAKGFKRDDPYLVPIALDNYFGLADSGYKTLQEELSLTEALILADVGNNSSTGLKLAKLVSNSVKPTFLTNSAASLFSNYANEVLKNPNLTLVINLQNLQKLVKASSIKLSTSLSSDQGINKKIDSLSKIQEQIKSKIVLIDEGRVVSVDQQYYLNLELDSSDLSLVADLACWSIWSPNSSFLEQLFISNS